MSLKRLCLTLTLGALSAGCRSGRDQRAWDGDDPEDRRSDPQAESLEVNGTTFEVRGHHIGSRALSEVTHAVEDAGRALERWGEFRDPITVTVLADARELDQAVGEGRFPGRKGFSRYDQVFLLSPEAWSARGARGAELQELVLHELTHALMYQQAASRTDWRRKGIPFWFREGMASYTARQAYRWKEPSRRELEEDEADGDNPEVQDVRGRYGAAHYAFDALLSRGGERRIRELLDEMQDGAKFDDAFEDIYRQPEPRFLAELERSLPERE